MISNTTAPPVDLSAARSLLSGHNGDPFALLGAHTHGRKRVVRAFDPGAESMAAVIGPKCYPLAPVLEAPGLFQGYVPGAKPYVLRGMGFGTHWDSVDVYALPPVLGDVDLYLLGEGTHQRVWTALGAHVREHAGHHGTHFAVWAPSARRVSVVGEFNQWTGTRHPMRNLGQGIWEIFLPGVGDGSPYKYEIMGADGTIQPLKADPVGFGAEHAPKTASIVRDINGYGWKDAEWMQTRAGRNARSAPISIYEVHLGSWKRKADDGGRPLSYREAAIELVDYAVNMGFTHLELLPISEHPFDGSWGYQPIGLYAPTVRHGPPHEFRDLVEAAHAKGLGVLLDWVPGHFPADDHGLAQFDGSHLYEHADPKEGFHQDWNTLIYNFGRTEVCNFLTSNALYWLEEYHIDGLRVDAVASMLYRDYSRKAGEWIPNKDGGRENYEAIGMLQQMNIQTYGAVDGIMTVAEESTSYPGVSQPVDHGGLGFGYKWNMGWMNDTLDYISREPVHRKHHHHQMTFGIDYAFSENFILPISHDEVVHGKGSMLTRMPGDGWQKFATLRAYYGFMFGHPGKKLLFMGTEFGQHSEWKQAGEIDWPALQDPAHAGVQRLVRDLNTLYRGTPALHVYDCEARGFQWIDGGDAEGSVLSWLRFGDDGDATVAVICNFTPVERSDYRIGLPHAGQWEEVFNSDARLYGGEDRGNLGGVSTGDGGWHGQAHSANLVLPALSTIILKYNTTHT